MTKFDKIITAIALPIAVVVAVTEPMVWRLPSGTALSSYGSRPQAVAPAPASIAIAEGETK